MISPVIACLRTSAPNVGPMSSTLTSFVDARLIGEAPEQGVAVAGLGERLGPDRHLVAAHDLHLGALAARIGHRRLNVGHADICLGRELDLRAAIEVDRVFSPPTASPRIDSAISAPENPKKIRRRSTNRKCRIV